MPKQPKSTPRQRAGLDQERARREQALDEALMNTFPASDPISIEQPAPDAQTRAPSAT